jgi:hypothetical protein
MSFRVQVDPDVAVLLRSLSPHVVLQIGHALAELAETASAQQGPLLLASGRMQVDGAVVLYDVDRTEQTLQIRHIEVREDLSAETEAVA